MRKTEKGHNSVMDLENFTKSSSGSRDILFTSFHWLIMRKTEKGDASVMD